MRIIILLSILMAMFINNHYNNITAEASLLPDLVIKNITLNRNCQVVVTVKNNGPGKVPDTVWTHHHPKSAGVYLYINGNEWGGASIWLFDPMKNLQSPGGIATYISKLKVSGLATITAKVDLWNVVKETNEYNNKKMKRLICKPYRKDLSIRIMRCPKVVKAGEALGANFKIIGKSSFPGPINNVAVDIILSSDTNYPVPAPYATYSPNYSEDILLKGGREHISFTGPGIVNVKLNGINEIPNNTPAGIYYLGAVIDAGNKVSESNENNNVSFCRIRVIPKNNCRRRFPNPIIKFDHKDAQGRIYIPVVNWSVYPDEMFRAAPELPPCGLNKNASRTWVEIYDADTNKRIYGFCAFGDNENLTRIWFKPSRDIKHVYIILKDRACNRTYKSNIISLPLK